MEITKISEAQAREMVELIERRCSDEIDDAISILREYGYIEQSAEEVFESAISQIDGYKKEIPIQDVMNLLFLARDAIREAKEK